jgi:hypothetical protein
LPHPTQLDLHIYRRRNLVERYFNKLKHFWAHRDTLREAGPQLPRRRRSSLDTPLDKGL